MKFWYIQNLIFRIMDLFKIELNVKNQVSVSQVGKLEIVRNSYG